MLHNTAQKGHCLIAVNTWAISSVPGATAAHFLASSPADALPLTPGTAPLRDVVVLGWGLKAGSGGISHRLPQAGTMGLWKWNIALTELWSETSSAPKSYTFGTSLVYNGGSVLMQASSKAWLYGPRRQNTERDGLIAAWWTAYCLVGMSAIKDHSQPTWALIPGAVQSFLVWFAPMLAIPSARNMVSSAFTDICFWPRVAPFAHLMTTDWFV